MKVGPTKALFFLVNNRSLVSLSKTMAEIYAENRNDDGFLYIQYASQEGIYHQDLNDLKL